METIGDYLDELKNSVDYLLKTEKECLFNVQFYNRIDDLKQNLVQEYFNLRKILTQLEYLKESSKNDVKILIENQLINRIDFNYFITQINEIKIKIDNLFSVFNITQNHINNLEMYSGLEINYKNQQFKLRNLRLNEKELIETIQGLEKEIELLNVPDIQMYKPISKDSTYQESARSATNVVIDQQVFIPEFFILSDEQIELAQIEKQINLDLKSKFLTVKKLKTWYNLLLKSKIDLEREILDILLHKSIPDGKIVFFFVVLFNENCKIDINFASLESKAFKKLNFSFIINDKLINSIPFYKTHMITTKRLSGKKNELNRKLRNELDEFKEKNVIDMNLINQAKDNIKLIKDFQNEAIQNYESTRILNAQKVEKLVEQVKAYKKEQTDEIKHNRLSKLNECKTKLSRVKDDIFSLTIDMNENSKKIEEVETAINNFIHNMNEKTRTFFDSSNPNYFYVLKLIKEFESKLKSLVERQNMIEICLNEIMYNLLTNQPINNFIIKLRSLV